MTNNLIIFVKYPEPGHVKTRLGKIIGFEKAAEIYSSLTNYLINSLSGSENFSISVFYTPADKKKQIKSWFNNQNIYFFPQQGQSLGEKISNAFDHSFSHGFKNTVVIGSDCIELNSDTVLYAFNSLNRSCDSVVGPTHDGGYYLIGLKDRNYPPIFKNIPWSTNKVYIKTLKKINDLNLKNIVLEKLNDVDDINDIDSNILQLVRNYYPNFEV